MGQSAGSQSIILHLMNENMTDKFVGVILQSCPIQISFRTQEDALKQVEPFAAALNCDTTYIDCMRSKSASEVYDASRKIPLDFSSMLTALGQWIAVVNDNRTTRYLEQIYVTDPSETLNKLTMKPTLIGTVEDEGIEYIYTGFTSPVPRSQYFGLMVLVGRFSAFSSLMKYPSNDTNDSRVALANVVTDIVFKCPAHMVATKIKSSKDVWLYNMKLGFEREGAWANHEYCEDKVCHGEDIPYLFQSFYLGDFQLTTAEQSVSDAMINYFSNFIKTGDPNFGDAESLSEVS